MSRIRARGGADGRRGKKGVEAKIVRLEGGAQRWGQGKLGGLRDCCLHGVVCGPQLQPLYSQTRFLRASREGVMTSSPTNCSILSWAYKQSE
jgi:hypothetical protein